MNLIEYYKSQFFKSELVHLNNAGLAPINLAAKTEIEHWAKRFYQEGFNTDADYMNRVSWSRQQLSHLIGCSADEIAFFQSASGAISQFAFQIGLKENDEVLTWDQEYSSNLYPWQEACLRTKSKLILAPSEPDLSMSVDKIISLISNHTKVITVSWVQFQTGAISPLEQLSEICKNKKIHLFVDVMQGLGVIPFDMSKFHISAVAGGSHKWLTSAVGVGYLAIRKDLALKMSPLMVGSSTYGTCDDPSDLECLPKRDATKFESGSKQVLEITALGASCELILKTQVETLFTETLRLKTKLNDGLQSLGFKLHNGLDKKNNSPSIVNFTSSKKSANEIKEQLKKYSINCALRGPGVRLSPAGFNSDEDIDKTLQALKMIQG